MKAYPDNKCVWGYMLVCNQCLDKVPKHVDLRKPIDNPPALGKIQSCEICKNKGILTNKEGT